MLYTNDAVFVVQSVDIRPDFHRHVTVSHQEASHNVQGLVDTGASICLIDSTFAVDSCHIKIALSNATIGNTSGKRINSFRINLDSISMGDRVYSNVCCYLVDLAGKLKQYAPKFIIGGDVLKRDLWCFDLNQNVMKRYDTVPANSKRTLSWKNHEDYSDAALNSIYLEGKISGKKTRIFFDTGSRKNELPEYFKVLPTKDIEIESANIADKLTLKEEKLCENTPVEIAEDKYLVKIGKRIKEIILGTTSPIVYKIVFFIVLVFIYYFHHRFFIKSFKKNIISFKAFVIFYYIC